MGVWGQGGGSGFAGYDFVQTAEPADPEEGQTWYDIDADAAYVYDGAGWIEMTVTDHGQLANVSAGQHRSDQNIRTTVNGQVDADTVDGQHASALATETVEKTASSTWTHDWAAQTDSEILASVSDPSLALYCRLYAEAETLNGQYAGDKSRTRVQLIAEYDDASTTVLTTCSSTWSVNDDGVVSNSLNETHQSAGTSWGLNARNIVEVRAKAIYEIEKSSSGDPSSNHAADATFGVL